HAIETRSNRTSQLREALKLCLRAGLAQETVEMSLRCPLGIVDDPATVQAAVNANRYKTGLMPNRGFGGICERFHPLRLRGGLDFVYVVQGDVPSAGVDRCCRAVGHCLILLKRGFQKA